MLYPIKLWKVISAEVDKLNFYKKQERSFVRYFYRGAQELSLDSAGRLLLPKKLLDYAEIEKELIIFAKQGRMELWSIPNYEALIEEEPDDFGELSEEVMGGIGFGNVVSDDT